MNAIACQIEAFYKVLNGTHQCVSATHSMDRGKSIWKVTVGTANATNDTLDGALVSLRNALDASLSRRIKDLREQVETLRDVQKEVNDGNKEKA